MASLMTTIKVTVEQITKTFRSERMPGSDEVRLVEIPPGEESNGWRLLSGLELSAIMEPPS